MTIKTKGSLYIKGKRIDFPHQIVGCLKLKDIVVVSLEIEKGQPGYLNNIWAFDYDGNKLWEIEDPNKENSDPYLMIWKNNEDKESFFCQSRYFSKENDKTNYEIYLVKTNDGSIKLVERNMAPSGIWQEYGIVNSELKKGEKEDVKIISYLILNEFEIELVNNVNCSIEMHDRVIVLLNWFKASNLYNINQNIFCYSKKTGEVLWQIEHKNLKGDVTDDVFAGMVVIFNVDQSDQEAIRITDLLQKEIFLENFDPEKDEIRANTMNGHAYKIDHLTGKTTYLYHRRF